MFYTHEAQERKVNVHPMCATLPRQSLAQGNMADYLLDRNLDPGLARKNGWYQSTDCNDEYARVVIPAATHKTGHVYWQARDTTGKAFIRYQSPKGPRHEALIKIEPSAPSNPRGIVVVEGPMDALAAAGEGYLAYALMGMKPSKATLMHLALLIEDMCELDILVILDRGEFANSMAVSTFLSTQGYHAKAAELPEKDLAQCLPEKRRAFLSQSFKRLFK